MSRLKLGDMAPLGRGEDRVVYPHPHDATRCIKIPRYEVHSLPVQGVRDWLYYFSRLGRKEFFDYNYTDVLYARELEQRDDPGLFAHLPRCYGFVETDLGRGVVWERICDFDLSPCATLRDCYYEPGRFGPEENRLLWQALQEFFAWQLQHGVMLREMAFVNTMVRRLAPDQLRLYHIDAIGCVDLIPLAAHARWFARLRIRSKIHRFRKHMLKWLGPPPRE